MVMHRLCREGQGLPYINLTILVTEYYAEDDSSFIDHSLGDAIVQKIMNKLC